MSRGRDSARVPTAHTPSEAQNSPYAGDFGTRPESCEACWGNLAGIGPGQSGP